MFIDFFYLLRQKGLKLSPTGFIRLHEALQKGLIVSLEDFYSIGRAVMIKSERHFDIYDRIFAHYFHGKDLPDDMEEQVDKMIESMLKDWLKDPKTMAKVLGLSEDEVKKMTAEELEAYFRKRMEDQSERHDGGNRWIGTGGTSPVGHSGYHPGGMRVGGASHNHSAIKVALDRRYRDYTQDGRIGPAQINEAMRRLKHMTPSGPKDRLNIDETIYQTMKNAGEIEICFDRALRDKLKVILMIDNGGFSMDPYIGVVQTIFNHARDQFKDLRIFYFHNTIYSRVWKDPARYEKPVNIEDLARYDSDTRVIMVGDAYMAPYELFSRHGNIYYNAPQRQSSIKRMETLANTFKHRVWLNPRHAYAWSHSETIATINKLFPMFEITLDGLEKAIDCLMDMRP
ncbi:MAG: hypothetical protein U9P80_04465 [Thermodesulfobacteriota bacterium]|nr:hypothetical protein [Thermodesulfobacteriota bacterium]